MKKKKILIIAPYIGNVNLSKSNRFLKVADLLNSYGYEISLITSRFCHREKSYFLDSSFLGFPYKVITINAFPYYSNISIFRLISNFSFGFNLFLYLLKNKEKNSIYYSAFPFLEASIPIMLIKGRNDQFIIDLQDLWPESFSLSEKFKKLFLINKLFSQTHLLFNKYIFSSADVLLSVSNAFINHAIKKYNFPAFKPTYVLYIGSNIPFDFRITNIYKRIEELSLTEFDIGYIGNVSRSYDLSELLLLISKYNKKNSTSIGLKIVGFGDEIKKIRKISSKLEVRLRVTGFVKYDLAMHELSTCLIAANPINKSSVSSIINKHSDYAFLGMPILNSQRSKEYIAMLKKYKCGKNYDSFSYKTFEKALNYFLQDKERLSSASLASRKMWEENFDREKTYPLVLQKLLGNLFNE